jgi:hypothetical protein
MDVKSLIKKLQEFDQDSVVVLLDADRKGWCNIDVVVHWGSSVGITPDTYLPFTSDRE